MIITSIFIYNIADDNLETLHLSDVRFEGLIIRVSEIIKAKGELAVVNAIIRTHDQTDWIYAQRVNDGQIILYTAAFLLNEAAMYGCFAHIKFQLDIKRETAGFLAELEAQLSFLSVDELQHREKIKSIEADLAVTITELQLDVEKILDRGEKLERLLQHTERLTEHSLSFTTKAFKKKQSAFIAANFFNKLFCFGDTPDNTDETVPFLGSKPSPPI